MSTIFNIKNKTKSKWKWKWMKLEKNNLKHNPKQRKTNKERIIIEFFSFIFFIKI